MLTLVIGGARSGKSSFAMSQCPRESNVTFVATAFPSDDEMRSRIDRHRRERPSHWKTVECPRALAKTVAEATTPLKPPVTDFDCHTDS
jgi:adenosylcobinamide kinase/adenosylcobinamide-phosphate guanylyltransferase